LIKNKEKIFEVTGKVEWLNLSFYIKKNGFHVTAIKLKESKYPFVDWKLRIKKYPLKDRFVKIEYTNWATRGLNNLGFHHVIESFQIIKQSSDSSASICKEEKVQ
jgi:hypothetical protein